MRTRTFLAGAVFVLMAALLAGCTTEDTDGDSIPDSVDQCPDNGDTAVEPCDESGSGGSDSSGDDTSTTSDSSGSDSGGLLGGSDDAGGSSDGGTSSSGSCEGSWVGSGYGDGNCASHELLQIKTDKFGDECDRRCVSDCQREYAGHCVDEVHAQDRCAKDPVQESGLCGTGDVCCPR